MRRVTVRRLLGFLIATGMTAILWQVVPVVAGSQPSNGAPQDAAKVDLPPPDQAQQDAVVKQLPAGQGKDILVRTCAGCHLLSVVTVQRKSEEQWTDTVIEMRGRGAQASDDDLVALVEYLAKNFGPQSPPARVNINTASGVEIAGALGVTEQEANAIVDYRAKNGKFKDSEGVKEVPGVEAAKIDAAKDRLDF